MTRSRTVTCVSIGLCAVVAFTALPGAIHAQVLTLQAVVDSALATHPKVLGAEARVERGQAGVSAARAQLFPSLALSGSWTRFEEPMVVAPLHGFDPTHPPAFDRTLVQGQVGLEYTVWDGGARGARIRAAEAGEGGLVAGLDDARMQLLEDVVAAYTGVLGSRDLRAAAGLQVAALESERDHAKQRLAEGAAARVEVLRADAALLDARAQQATADARATLAERNLARFMGVDAAALEGRALVDISARPDTDATPGTDPRLEAAQRAVDAAVARLDTERAGRLPSLKAGAGLQTYGSAAGDYVTEWNAGMRVSLPLFTGGARTAAIRAAEADLRAARQDLKQTDLAIAATLDAANAEVMEATARLQALDASVAQWEEVERVEALSLETGAGVQQDYLRAEASLFQARAGRARARYDAIVAHVGRARAQGHLDRAWLNEALEIR